MSKTNYHIANLFSENLLAIEMKRSQTFMNTPLYLGLSILGMNKIVMYEFWYNYVKPKYEEKARSCYMNADSFIVYIKTEDIYVDIEKDVETRFDT